MEQPKPVIDQAMTAVTYYLHLARGQLAVGNYEAGLNALLHRVGEHLAVAVSAVNLDDEVYKPLSGLCLAWAQQILAFNMTTRAQRVGRLKNNFTVGAAELRQHAPALAREYEEFVDEASLFLEPRPPATVTLRGISDALVILEDPFRRAQEKLLPVIAALMPREVIVAFDAPESVAAGKTSTKPDNNGKHRS